MGEPDSPRVLIMVPHYLPGYKSGGPVRSIANLVEQLGDEFRFLVITSDRDPMDSQAYPDINSNAWTARGKANVFYASPAFLRRSSLLNIVKDTPSDLVYLNSFFHPNFTGRILLANRFGLLGKRRVVLAPRGEFSPGALELKRWKKRLCLAAWRALGFGRDIVWQASSKHELRNILDTFPTVQRGQIRVAPNLSQHPRSIEKGERGDEDNTAGPIKVLYLSRIARNKNLDIALSIVSQVSVRTEFNIYGPASDEAYWLECQALMDAAPSHVGITYHGPVSPEQVHEVMAEHDLYLLPTRGENYGHVIAEALSVGTPVLISDRTPWRDLESAGVGWDLPLENEGRFTEMIEVLARMTPRERSAMREETRSWAQDRISNPEVVEASRTLFLDAIAGRV